MDRRGHGNRRSAVRYSDSYDQNSSSSQIHSQAGSILHNSIIGSFPNVEDSLAPFRTAQSDNTAPKHYRELVRRLLLSTPYTIAFVSCVVFSMYGNDLRVLVGRKEADSVFAVCFVMLLGVFALDLVLQSVGNEGYFLSFSFGMDALATVTVLADISWVWETTADCSAVISVVKDVQNVARVAARSRRIIEVIRILRLMRLVKLYKGSSLLLGLHSTLDHKRKQQLIQEERDLKRRVKVFKYGSKIQVSASTFRHESTSVTKGRESLYHSTFTHLYLANKNKSLSMSQETPEIPEESQVSHALIDRMVVLIFLTALTVVVAFPLFSANNYLPTPSSQAFGLKVLDDFKDASIDTQKVASEYVSTHTDIASLSKILRLYESGTIFFAADSSPDDIRPCDKQSYASKYFLAVFDNRQEAYLSAWLHILHSTFSCSLILMCTVLLFYDYSVNIFIGLERIVNFVRKIAKNPMVLLMEKPSHLIASKFSECCCLFSNRDYGKLEMKRLEDSIYKIGVMLVLGFGTAGCEIITRNINDIGSVNPLIPGKKIFAAFAFISINRFNMLATILEGDIMKYANTVSLLVHSVCEKYQGTVNRNLGDCYLVVWKFQEDDLIKTSNKVLSNALSQSVRLQTAFALLSALRICVKVARASSMSLYHEDLRITSRMPYFSNKLTVGLHVGWGVEGPVGSVLKIDATYISPDVNIASRLESATRIYGVLILASEAFVRHLDEPIQTYLRHVDTVKFKGSEEVIMIYSFDLSLRNLGVSSKLPKKQLTDEKRQKVREAFEFNYFSIHLLFNNSKKLQLMREMHTAAFRADYDHALRQYQARDWQGAGKTLRDKCLHHLPTDGPSNSLLRYMEGFHYTPPTDWAGVRVLHSK